MNIFDIIDKKQEKDQKPKQETFDDFLNKIIERGSFKFQSPRCLLSGSDMMMHKRLQVMEAYLKKYPEMTNWEFKKMLNPKNLAYYKNLFEKYKGDFVKDIKEKGFQTIFNNIDSESKLGEDVVK